MSKAPTIDVEHYKQEAIRAERLAELQCVLPEFLSPGKSRAVLVGDTAIFENYLDIASAAIWFGGLHYEWLVSNMTLNAQTGDSIFHRIVLLPYPRVVHNWRKRRNLLQFILLHLHLHLWHGVVCGVKFLDPTKFRRWNPDDLHFT